jgi:hypothetical protein
MHQSKNRIAEMVALVNHFGCSLLLLTHKGVSTHWLKLQILFLLLPYNVSFRGNNDIDNPSVRRIERIVRVFSKQVHSWSIRHIPTREAEPCGLMEEIIPILLSLPNCYGSSAPRHSTRAHLTYPEKPKAHPEHWVLKYTPLPDQVGSERN